MEVKKSNHGAYQTHYHIVFPVKYRKGLLFPDIDKTVKEIASAIEEKYKIELEQIGSDKNHIHILCSFHPKYSISAVVRIFKSISAREIFKRNSEDSSFKCNFG